MSGEGNFRAHWDHSITFEDRIRGNPLYEEPDEATPRGRFAGREVIARDTPITGGVYLGAGVREAIVVDDDKYTEEYDVVYNELLREIYQIVESDPELSVQEKVLEPVFETVRRALSYDSSAVEQLTQGYHDRKINLGAFIKSGAGVCRHQALLAGYFLERLRSAQELLPEDKISVDRNTIPGRGGHAWVRYTASDGEVYIIDPAQNVVGKLADLQGIYWDYERPE